MLDLAVARARPATLTCLALALACSSTPGAQAPTATDEAQPSGPAVFVEAQPDPRRVRESRLPEQARQLYECWFSEPYEYMFETPEIDGLIVGELEGPPLTIGQREFGTFTAGMRGILFYGGLADCARLSLGRERTGFLDLSSLETLAGVPATMPRDDLPFDAVNPAFVTWGRNLLPDPSERLWDVSAQTIYTRVFARFFRLMTESVLLLLEDQSIAADTQAYLSATQSGAAGINWLEAHFAGRLTSYGDVLDGTRMTPAMATGFWLRRHADGSFVACWHALRDVMTRYDRSWLRSVEDGYPGAVTQLANTRDPLEALEGRPR